VISGVGREDAVQLWKDFGNSRNFVYNGRLGVPTTTPTLTTTATSTILNPLEVTDE